MIDPEHWEALKELHGLNPPEGPVPFYPGARGEDGDDEEPSASPAIAPDDRFDILISPRPQRGEGRGRLGRVLNLIRITKTERDERLQEMVKLDGPDDNKRRLPLTRGGCADVPRPCPHVGCRHHLYLDLAGRRGNVRIAFAGKEPWELEHSCSIDVAEVRPRILDEMAAVLGITRERTRQIFERAMERMFEKFQELGITREDIFDV